MKISHFTFYILHFTFISQFLRHAKKMAFGQLAFINAAQWKMANGKLLVNGKWPMVNISRGDLV
ncbi:hypothetical protein COU91_03820 [Candidatus Saccharibacteria bacterium CG10_big_fil_rev_8_21_14_0_10_47_8]|nr:MAG: hypothetical protein COU91_03820 [Candidatus Saccharibacteria bacterium CG10_big_fil_rev_8_21_14_0_10_47_8]